MSDSQATELSIVELIRQLRQRVESLSRAGLDRAPVKQWEFQSATGARPNAPASPMERPSSIRESQGVSMTDAKPDQPPATARVQPKTVEAAVQHESLFGSSGFEGSPLPKGDRDKALELVSREVEACTRCPILVANRSRTVFGAGDNCAKLMFVGEAPGADEDRTGQPFVGRAGGLLTDMITKGMGLSRDEVYIANAIKCRPPENRPPEPDEIGFCRGYLERQIEIVRPEFLCILGRTAVASLLQTALPMNRLRLRWHRYKGIPSIVTYHPSYLLRNPAAKRDTWEDLKMLMDAMGLKPSGPAQT